MRSSRHVHLVPHSSDESFIINIHKVFLDKTMVHCRLDGRCPGQQDDQAASDCNHRGER